MFVGVTQHAFTIDMCIYPQIHGRMNWGWGIPRLICTPHTHTRTTHNTRHTHSHTTHTHTHPHTPHTHNTTTPHTETQSEVFIVLMQILKALRCNLPSGAWNSPHSVWCHAELRNRSAHCSSEGKKDREGGRENWYWDSHSNLLLLLFI